jgi:putative pyruvate formate lyase activating enzyme
MTTAGTSATSRNRKRRPVAPRRLEPGSRAATKRIAEARALLEECSVCPRDCGAHRLDGEIGTCRTGADLVVASANLHHGEEPPISGFGGSGTVFLSGCSMRCTYCQNYPISQQRAGSAVSIADVAGMMLDLQRRGVHNINLVTPTHFTPQLIQAVLRARTGGLTVPIVWNTSGYERVETLRLLDGIVDIYLADMRYGDAAVAKRYSGVEDYPPGGRSDAEPRRDCGPGAPGSSSGFAWGELGLG